MKTKTKLQSRAGRDDYFELVRRFPLRPIRSEGNLEQAAAMLRELLIRADREGLSGGESDYADALGVFLREYDQQHASILQNRRKIPPLEMLKYLMQEHGMNAARLGELLGSGSGQASMILRGKRQLSKANIRVLADHFAVSPALFL